MKYTYRFVTGEAVGIEVSPELEALLKNEDRLEYNNDHANTRRHVSMNTAQEYQGAAFVDPKMDTPAEALAHMEREELLRAMESLVPQQKELIWQVFFAERSLQSLSEEMGISYQAVQNRLRKALERLEKNFP